MFLKRGEFFYDVQYATLISKKCKQENICYKFIVEFVRNILADDLLEPNIILKFENNYIVLFKAYVYIIWHP